jgi:fibronectin-binding autotransporter adhesin
MKNRPNPFLRSAALATSIVLCVGTAAHAGSLTWDGSDTVTTGAQGGAGTWNQSTVTIPANWWDGSANVVWPASGADNDAIFGGTAGTVTIDAGGVTVNDMLFTTTGYILSGAGTITLNGTTPTITLGSGISATIGNNTATVVDGTSGLTKAGAGTLTLNGTTANTFTGGLNIKGGTLALDFSNFGGSTPFNNLVASTNALTLGGGTLSITGKSVAGTSSQTFASTTVNAGRSTLTLTNGTGATSVTANLGALTVNQGGVVILTATPSGTVRYTVSSSGGNLTWNGSAQTWARAGVMYGSGTSTRWAQVDTSGNIALSAASIALGTTEAGPGSATLLSNIVTNNVSITGDFQSYGTLMNEGATARTATIADTKTWTLNGIIQINTVTGSIAALGSGKVKIGPERDFVINAANSGGVTISAPITEDTGSPSSVTINSTSTGATTLSGANTFSGGVYMNSGTLTLGVGSVGSVGSITSGALGKGTLTLSGGIINTGAFTHMNAINVTAGTTTNIFGAGTLTGPITGTGTFSNDSTVGGASATLAMQGDISGFQGTFNFNNTTLNRNNFNFNATTGNALDGSQAKFVVNGVITGSNIRQLTLGGTNAVFKAGELSGTGGQVQSAGTIEIGYLNTDSSFTGQIIGSSTKITKVGSGTLTLGGANTYTGVTTVNAGILKAGSTTAFGPAANASLAFGASSAGKVQLNGNSMTVISLNSNATPGTPVLENANAGGATLTVNNASLSSYAGAMQDGTGGGALSLIKTAAGTLTLSGNNSYTGTTAINVGTLVATKAGALAGYNVGSKISVANLATLFINYGGVSDWDQTQVGSLLTNNGAGFAVGSTLTFDTTNGSGSYGTDIASASFALTKLGTNTLTLSGNNAYTGVTAITDGVLKIQSNTALGTTAGNTTIASAKKLQIEGDGLSIAENFTVTGGTIENVSGSNTLTGNITKASTVNLLSTSGTLTIQGGIDGTNNSVNLQGAGNGEISGVISTAFAVAKSDAGTWTLSGASANTYGTLTTVSSGTLLLAKSGAVNAIAGGGITIGGATNTAATAQYTGASSDMMGAGAVTINGRGILDFNGKTDTIGNVAIVSTGATTSNPTPIINTAGGGNLIIGTLGITPVAGFTSVINSSTGTLTLGGNVTFTAATTGQAQVAGKLDLGGATRTFTVNNGSGAGYDLLVDADISSSAGTFGLTKAGAGELKLSGVNTYTGTTTLTTGALQIGVDSVGSVGFITSSAVGTGTLTFNGGTLSSDSGTARTILNAVTFTGNVTLGDSTNNGKLTFGAGMDLGAATRTMTLNSDVQLDGAFSNPTTTTNATGFIKAGAGTLTINASNAGINWLAPGSPNPSGFVITAGKVIAANTAAFGNAGQIVTLNGGTVEFATDTASNSYVLNQNTSNNGTVILNRATSDTAITYSMGTAQLGRSVNFNVQKGGNVTDTPTLTLAGLSLTAGSTGGNTILNPTTANISITGGVSSTSNFAKNLQLDGTSTGNTISGDITNGTNVVTLIKANTGTWTLSGSNSYTGATNVNTGILAVNGNQSTANGAVTVASTATLKGTGTVGGATTIQTGGIMNAGAHSDNSPTATAPVGKQTFSSDLTLASQSIFAWDLSGEKDTSTGTRGTDYDAVDVGGNLNVSVFDTDTDGAGPDTITPTPASDAIFRVIVSSAFDFTTVFWDNTHTWSDIFTVTGTNTGWAAGTTVDVNTYNFANNTYTTANPTAQGAFTISGSTLTWSAVPEPTSAFVGILIGAGLLRRRRVA